VCELPHTMLSSVRRLRALEYAQTLYPGATVDENDLRYCWEFIRELPAALAHHGLKLVNGVCERLVADNNNETKEMNT